MQKKEGERLQGCSHDGIDTHQTSYFKEIFKQIMPHVMELARGRRIIQEHLNRDGPIIIDPFARNCELAGEWTNDLDLDTEARHHVDALQFIKTAPRIHFELAILDPPFSSAMAERKYGAKNIYADGSYFSKVAKALVDNLVSGGFLLKFGFNTTRHDGRLELVKFWSCNCGGNRNDVLVSLWRKSQTTLAEFTDR
jgi:hypothetical protein